VILPPVSWFIWKAVLATCIVVPKGDDGSPKFPTAAFAFSASFMDPTTLGIPKSMPMATTPAIPFAPPGLSKGGPQSGVAGLLPYFTMMDPMSIMMAVMGKTEMLAIRFFIHPSNAWLPGNAPKRS